MEIGASEYRYAAIENLDSALVAHSSGLYVSSHYLAGLSVECMLRAYRWRVDGQWDGRHFLPRLLRESGLLKEVPEDALLTFIDRFAELSRCWSNEHRYTSDGKLMKRLNSIQASWGVKGDKLKENSRIMTEAANFIVGIGRKKWDSQ